MPAVPAGASSLSLCHRSDAEIVEQLRTHLRRRRVLGWVMVVFAVTAGIPTFYWLTRVGQSAGDLISDFAPAGPPADAELWQQYGETWLVIGITLGVMFTKIIVMSTWMGLFGVWMALARDRRTELLVRLWDDAHRADNPVPPPSNAELPPGR
jgi:hypothetical protein